MVTTRIGYFNIKSAVFCRQSVLMCPAWFLQATAFVLRLLATCTLSIIWNSKNNMFNPAGYNRTISFQLVEDHFIYLPLNICTSGQVVSAEVSRKYAINVVGVPKIKKKKKPKQTEISTHKHQFRKGGGRVVLSPNNFRDNHLSLLLLRPSQFQFIKSDSLL